MKSQRLISLLTLTLASGLFVNYLQAQPSGHFDGLKVTLCGTSSPLVAEGRAQACVAIETPDHLYIVDAGSGSSIRANLSGLPTGKLHSLFITHFHSDHISDIGDFNLSSWVGGRPEPLQLVGGEGVAQLAEGLNMAYAMDRSYRVAHHGEEILDPALGLLGSKTVNAGVILEQNGLTVTAITAEHPPITPAFAYRFDYKGRSVVVSGDTIVTDEMINAVSGVDLLLHDAMSLTLIKGMENAVRTMGNERTAKILFDIQDYHATNENLSRFVDEAKVGQLALYHLVPSPRNAMAENAFKRELPEGSIITDDGMVFSLPAGSGDIDVTP